MCEPRYNRKNETAYSLLHFSWKKGLVIKCLNFCKISKNFIFFIKKFPSYKNEDENS